MRLEVIRTIDLSYTYPDGTQALRDINFVAERGECIAVLGPNGAGKSTFLQLLNGLLNPTEGKILLKGMEIKDRRRYVGLVFQNPEDQLIELTVGDDVAYGPLNMGLDEETVKRRVKEGLAAVNMEGQEERPIHTLSYGEKKRTAIAGVLAMRPEILALDEPTLGLDPRNASDMLKLLKKLKGDSVTIVVATHDVEAVPLFADRIYVLNAGRTCLAGTPHEVFSKKENIRQCSLRLPRIAHLFEILGKRDLPLTIGEAKRMLEGER
jgi:cobalt/nickel transport system ATP-binding protein